MEQNKEKKSKMKQKPKDLLLLLEMFEHSPLLDLFLKKNQKKENNKKTNPSFSKSNTFNESSFSPINISNSHA